MSSEATKSTTLKPWCLTFNQEDKEIFIWKNDVRLKLKDGSSAGPVTDVSILHQVDRTITLKGVGKDGCKYGFHCSLDKLKPANEFCHKLITYIGDPHMFCTQLCSLASGVVKFDSPSSSSSSICAPSFSYLQSRKRPIVGETPTTKKKVPQPQQEVMETIPEHQIGLYSLPVSTLREPPEYLRVREIKGWYVDYLVGMLMVEADDHEDITAPLLVLASVSKEDFKLKNLNSYSYQVIGGIQRFIAISKINDNNGRKITTRKCAVYGCGLSRGAALVLAKQHNSFNQIQRITSFPEVAACCRRLLFSHFGNGAEDTNEVEIEVPRYNRQTYRAFKQECLTYLVSSQMSQPMVEQAIQVALMRSDLYHKLQRVFLMFEEGKLKGQKVRQMTGVTLQKALEGKLAPKLQHFKVFQGLQDDRKELLLDKLLDGSLSYLEAEGESDQFKAEAKVKELLLKELDMKTWEEAEAAVPEFTKEEVLQKFHLKKGKPLPNNFKMFCERAKEAKQHGGSGEKQPEIQRVAEQGNVRVIAAGNLEHVPLHQADLMVVSVKEVSSSEEIADLISSLATDLQDCTMALYNVVSPGGKEIAALCKTHGAQCSRVFKVSTVVRVENDVSIGKSQEVALAWWGPGMIPQGHILGEDPEVDSIICHPEEEETMLTTQQCCAGWMKLLLNQYPKFVVDIHSISGELTQMCLGKGIECLSIQMSPELASSLVTTLGLCVEGCAIQGVDRVGEAPDQTHEGESQGVDGIRDQGLQEEVLIGGDVDWVEQAAPVGSGKGGAGETLLEVGNLEGGNQALEEGENLGVDQGGEGSASQGGAEVEGMNTDELLDELSAAEKGMDTEELLEELSAAEKVSQKVSRRRGRGRMGARRQPIPKLKTGLRSKKTI